jgi:hypothetical protein
METRTWIILAILTALATFLALAEELPQPDKDRPLYQKRWGGPVIAWPCGDVDEVAWPKPESIEEAQLRIEIERLEQNIADERALKQAGQREMKYGVLALVVGIVMAVILAHYGFELIGVAIAGLGLIGIVSGAITIKIADHITGIAVGSVCFVVIGLIAWFTHGKGFFKKKSKPKFS